MIKRYKQFITEDPINDDVMKNRENLTKWLYRVHNKVNNKLLKLQSIFV